MTRLKVATARHWPEVYWRFFHGMHLQLFEIILLGSQSRNGDPCSHRRYPSMCSFLRPFATIRTGAQVCARCSLVEKKKTFLHGVVLDSCSGLLSFVLTGSQS